MTNNLESFVDSLVSGAGTLVGQRIAKGLLTDVGSDTRPILLALRQQSERINQLELALVQLASRPQEPRVINSEEDLNALIRQLMGWPDG